MRQNQPGNKGIKPQLIKLTPFTPLPRLRLSTLSSPNEHSKVLPPITPISKTKTESSEKHFQSKQCLKTQPASAEYESQSSSSRLITRFIYNHLQKKLNFHLQNCKKYQEPLMNCDQQSPSANSDRQNPQQSFNIKLNKLDSLYPSSDPHLSYQVKEASSSQVLKLRNKYSVRAKAVQRNLAKDYRGRNRNRYANIDSYFDLSCLESFKHH